MSDISILFLISILVPFLIVGPFGIGSVSDNFVDAIIFVIVNWAVLFGGMWLVAQIARGILPVIVGFAIQIFFTYKALKDTGRI